MKKKDGIILSVLITLSFLMITNPTSKDFQNHINNDYYSGICELNHFNLVVDIYVLSMYESHAECYISDKQYLSSKNDTSFNYLQKIKSEEHTGIASIGNTFIGIANIFFDFH